MMPRTLPLLCALLFGCSGSAQPLPDGGGGHDASDPDGGSTGSDSGTLDASVRTVEVGTGMTMFMPVTEGQELALIAGPQGGGRNYGFDIPFGTRTRGYNPRGLMLKYELLLASDRSVQATQSLVFDLVKTGDAYTIFGSAPQIMDCCNVRGQDVFMRVEVTDAEGLTGSDERRVRAGASCRDPLSGTELCP